MEHELGPEIEIHGKRPDWLSDDENIAIRWYPDEGYRDSWASLSTPANCVHGWASAVYGIRLRADHPYYLATSRGFTYWPGGDDAPDADEVMFRNGMIVDANSMLRWRETGCDSDIIGYRKRMEPIDSHMNKVRYNAPFAPSNRPSDELVERMIAFIKEYGRYDTVARAILAAINPDPMIQRARDICKDEFGVILPDDAPGMRAVLRGLREGGE